MKSYLVCIITALVIFFLLREFGFIDFFTSEDYNKCAEDQEQNPWKKYNLYKKGKERKCTPRCKVYMNETGCGNQSHCKWENEECSVGKGWKVHKKMWN